MSSEEEFDANLVKVITLLFEEKLASNSKIMKFLEVGFDKANEYADKLVEYGLIPSLNGKRKPRKLLPQCIEDVSPEVWEWLEKYGYTTNDVEGFFNSREQ